MKFTQGMNETPWIHVCTFTYIFIPAAAPSDLKAPSHIFKVLYNEPQCRKRLDKKLNIKCVGKCKELRVCDENGNEMLVHVSFFLFFIHLEKKCLKVKRKLNPYKQIFFFWIRSYLFLEIFIFLLLDSLRLSFFQCIEFSAKRHWCLWILIAPASSSHHRPRARSDARISTLPCTGATLSPWHAPSPPLRRSPRSSAPLPTSQHLMNIEIGNFNIKAISPGYMSCAMPDKIRPRWHPVHILIRIHILVRVHMCGWWWCGGAGWAGCT